MIRALVWGLAGFGVIVSGVALTIVASGLLEGWHPMPDRATEVVALVLVGVAIWTAGLLCARTPGRWVVLAVSIAPLSVLAAGVLLMEKNESHGGAGVAPQLVVEAVALTAMLVGGAAYVARRSASSQ